MRVVVHYTLDLPFCSFLLLLTSLFLVLALLLLLFLLLLLCTRELLAHSRRAKLDNVCASRRLFLLKGKVQCRANV